MYKNNYKSFLISLMIIACFLVFVLPGYSQQTARPKPTDGSRNFGYYEYLPPGYETSDKDYPVILFLHGLGERGNGTTDLSDVLEHGPPKEINNGMQLPFVVISPQLSTSSSHWSGATTHEILTYVLNNYRIDQDSIYLTGLSLGGEGTLLYLTHEGRHPIRAAAASCPPTWRVTPEACEINGVPLRLWHGIEDPTVSWSESDKLVKAIDACNTSPNQKLPIFQTLARTDHDAWTNVYNVPFGNPNGIYTWFKGGLAVSSGGLRVKTVSSTNPTTLTVAGSAWDIDGSIVSYIWAPIAPAVSSMIDGSTTNDTIKLKNLTIGTHQFRFTVSNNLGQSISDILTVNITQKPVAYAGANKTITLPTNSVILEGSATDPDGDSFMAFRWNLESDHANKPTLKAEGSKLTVTNLSQGVYTFALRVIDSKFARSDKSFVTVTVNPAPPAAPLPGKIEAENYSSASDVTIQWTADGGGTKRMVGFIDQNDYLDYVIDVKKAGTYSMTFRVSRGSDGPTSFEIRKGLEVLNTVPVPQTGDWQTFQNVTVPVVLSQGVQTLRLFATNGGWNINWFEASNLVLPGKIEAEDFTGASNVTIQWTADGGGTKRMVGYIEKDDYLDYYVNVGTSGTYNLTFRVSREPQGSATFAVKNGSTTLSTVTIASTNDWQVFQNVTVPVALQSGNQTLRLLALDGNWNINWFDGSLPSSARIMENEVDEENEKMGVYPTPATSTLHVIYKAEQSRKGQVRLANAMGVFYNKEASLNKGENHLELNLDHLSTGIYILEISQGAQAITRRKVMVIR